MRCNGNTTNVCGGKDAIEVFSEDSDDQLLPVEYGSLGCYVWEEVPPVRGLDQTKNTIQSDDDMSPHACASACTIQMKADFWALLGGNSCTCGMEIAPGAKKASMDECNTPCTDGLGENCGGTWKAEVFTNKKKYVN
ncbi:hypothetical protein BFJ63_vAg16416 [Fusarium oxysporum f. sp. narcissi]|uniref:WSC domain-containing protein n=1 Tax=Fusarium oxysporum f. sp. narcissi TaxID=451672 RepID=A0A4Q2V397_FUSOX|nr:hypothetical protein FOWG_09918 [Fusarium oxysporum f. sp. lycopersici MN25]KAJ4125610.1 hypothetical protein NW765_001384 [Fusarium oxysporum]RKL15939.1 hypothetical protein BFJ70_g15193 [Fusarium oxysporum]RYC80690.1 hypothetical protein BFJ63_vAg16416 [Fusarium oxysporum f. sp. narcissi]